ncbi:hypothetical protein CLU79DRAFT_782080 [Phycomyces nitens]|nr:hypothetical protein CLU79DRAFT_782080 [Phycomyces nitens]
MSSVKSYPRPSSFSLGVWAKSQLRPKVTSTRVNQTSPLDPSELSFTSSIMLDDLKKHPSFLGRIFHRKKSPCARTKRKPFSNLSSPKLSKNYSAATEAWNLDEEEDEEDEDELSDMTTLPSPADMTTLLARTHLTTPLSPCTPLPGNTALKTEFNKLSKIYITTLTKLKAVSQDYTMSRYLSVCRVLAFLQQSKDAAPLLNQLARSHLFEREFTSSPLTRADSFSGSSRKPRRTRYVFMLLETPIDRIRHNIHPIQEATRRRRKPYADTAAVITRVNESLEGEPATNSTKSSPWISRKVRKQKPNTWKIVRSPVSNTVAQPEKAFQNHSHFLPNSVSTFAKYSRAPVRPLLDLSSPSSTPAPRKSKRILGRHNIWTTQSEPHLRSKFEEYGQPKKEGQDDDVPLGLLQATLPKTKFESDEKDEFARVSRRSRSLDNDLLGLPGGIASS